MYPTITMLMKLTKQSRKHSLQGCRNVSIAESRYMFLSMAGTASPVSAVFVAQAVIISAVARIKVNFFIIG